MMMKFLEPIQKTFADLKRDPVEQVKKSPVFWVLSILFLAWLIIEVPRWQASRVTLTDPDKYFQVENEARKTILQGLGGGFFFISAYFTWRSLQVSEKTRQAAEDKQVTERFVKAAEMLADEKDRLEVKTAGIYGLERIAHDSEDDHWTVMEVLTLLIRNKTASRHVDPEQKELLTFPEDLQVALTVIGRRDVKKDRDRRLDLAQANLSRADLSEGNFSRADLSEVNLSRANLIKANLSEANLSEANLSGAVLSEANFNGADLRGVNFSEADLSETNFSGADLRGTDLRWQDLSEAYLRGTNFNGADLSEANLRWQDLSGADLLRANLSGTNLRGVNFSGANLIKANLSGANLIEANLSGANFSGADLSNANLSGADLSDVNLRCAEFPTCEQVQEAKNWETAIYDLDFAERLGLDKDVQIGRAKEREKDYPF